MRDLRGYLEPREVEMILNGGETERNRLLGDVLWQTGARISEIVGLAKIDSVDGKDHRDWGLNPGMLDPNDNAIILNTLKRTKKDKKTKERKYSIVERRVVISKRLMSALIDYVQRKGIQKNERIFPISRRWASEIIKRMAERAGINPPGRDRIDGKEKHVHPHHFRHSHCINFIRHKDGIEGLRALQDRLKHISIATTAHYLQFSTKGKQAEIEEMFP